MLAFVHLLLLRWPAGHARVEERSQFVSGVNLRLSISHPEPGVPCRNYPLAFARAVRYVDSKSAALTASCALGPIFFQISLSPS